MAVFHNDQDWQAKKQYQKQEQMSSYPEPKQHQKSKQFPKPHQKGKQWVQEELPFNDKPWREPSLTNTEIEELFWGKLVQLGWKLQTYDEKTQKVNIVLPCSQCNKVLESFPKMNITKTLAATMSDSEKCQKLLKGHGGFTCSSVAKVCYMCQGEGILQSGEECGC